MEQLRVMTQMRLQGDWIMNERLEQLIDKAQHYQPHSRERRLIVSELVDQLLRSRPICRALKGQPLLAVQQTLYTQLREHLMDEVEQKLDQYNPKALSVREWAQPLQKLSLRTVLDDTHLKAFALAAQQQAQNSPQRRHLLGELAEALQLSGRLCRPHRGKFTPQFYALLYDEAVVETLSYICMNIDKYDPDQGQGKSFLTWVNFRLDKMMIECRRKFSHRETQDLPDLNDLDRIPQPVEEPSLSTLMREYIETDQDALFSKAQIRNRPDASFRAIALARLSGQSWEEISLALDIAIPTLSSFFQRTCRKFTPQFRKYLQS